MDGLGDPESVFSDGERLREGAAFGVAVSSARLGRSPRRYQLCQSVHSAGLPGASPHSAPDSPRPVDSLPRRNRPDPGSDVPGPGGRHARALRPGPGRAGRSRWRGHLAHHPERCAHAGVDPPEPQLVAERLSEGLGVAQMVEHPLRDFCQGIERTVLSRAGGQWPAR